MAMNILTQEDLHCFRDELFQELRSLINNSVQQPKKWLKTEEVKKLLRVSPGTLQTLRINGTLQYTKLGGIIYYDHDHIEKLMNKNLRKAKEQ